MLTWHADVAFNPVQVPGAMYIINYLLIIHLRKKVRTGEKCRLEKSARVSPSHGDDVAFWGVQK